jgi:hypothetical protein
MLTVACFAELAFRIRVSMSAMGSLILMLRSLLYFYQLAFITPGI